MLIILNCSCSNTLPADLVKSATKAAISLTYFSTLIELAFTLSRTSPARSKTRAIVMYHVPASSMRPNPPSYFPPVAPPLNPGGPPRSSSRSPRSSTYRFHLRTVSQYTNPNQGLRYHETILIPFARSSTRTPQGLSQDGRGHPGSPRSTTNPEGRCPN